jgi:RNA recognition motif-containing protein
VAKKLYIRNLSFDVTRAQIRDLFSQVGEVVSLNLITGRDTGSAKGFAFVEMSTESAAQDAIRRFDGYSLWDRPMNVREARPHKEHFKSGRPGRVR